MESTQPILASPLLRIAFFLEESKNQDYTTRKGRIKHPAEKEKRGKMT
jgi:hypothetical protein